jgi:rSAM/selenodomain-associated transferase 1
MPRNQLGVFARVPVAGAVKSRLVPPLFPDSACELYRAFLADLFERLGPVKVKITVFAAGEPVTELSSLFPKPWPVVPQATGDLGARMTAAFAHLLARPEGRAVLIGSDSPDLPLGYLKRAFQRLKHRDVVIGPALDGGYYLIGLRAPTPALFEGIEWGSNRVLAQTMAIIERDQLTVSLLPPWYDVDDMQSLELLRALCGARQLAGGVRLPRTERELSRLIV